MGVTVEHLLAISRVVLDNEVLDSIRMGTVGRQMAGRIPLPAIGVSNSVRRVCIHEVKLQTRVESNHGVARLLQGEVGLRSKSLTNVVVIGETEENGEKSELGRAVSPPTG